MIQRIEINRYQIIVMLLTAVGTYQGLSRILGAPGGFSQESRLRAQARSQGQMPSAAEQQIDAVKSSIASPVTSQTTVMTGYEPVIQTLPLQTQVVGSRHRGHATPKKNRRHQLHSEKTQAEKPHAAAEPLDLRSLGVQIEGFDPRGVVRSEATIASVSTREGDASISEELARELSLGLVPETIVLPERERYEVSSLILVKPIPSQKALKD